MERCCCLTRQHLFSTYRIEYQNNGFHFYKILKFYIYFCARVYYNRTATFGSALPCALRLKNQVENNMENQASATVQPKKKFVGRKESWALALAGMGQGMMYATMSSYISDFYINIMGLPLIFVLLLMLLARVWDAVNDPMMGVIVDKTKPGKFGKMKPFIFLFAIPIAVATFLMFYAPEGFNTTQNMIYAGVVYVAWGMLYTAADVPFWALPNVMTPDPDERGRIISTTKTVNGIGSAIPMAIFMILSWIPYFSDGATLAAEKQKYMVIALVCSLLGTALYILAFFYPKERVIIPPKAKKNKNEPGTLKRLFSCKPLMLVVLCGVLSSGRYMMQAAAIHVARYAFYIGPSLENITDAALRQQYISGSVGTVSTLFQICSAIGMFGSMLAMPFLYKKFNYKQIVIVSCLGGFVASIVTTVLGACSIFTVANWLVYLMIPFIIVQCIPLGALNVTMFAMIGDSLDYLEWSTGFRDNALGAACQSFVNKLGNAFATTFIVIMYLIVNIDPAQSVAQNAVKAVTDMTGAQRFGIFALVSIVPGISLILCAIPIFFYDIVGEKKDRITRELEFMRAEKGIEIAA